jgi:uroporphyrinogen-III synthase
MSGALAGRAVLVTRPAGLSGRLVALLRAEGGEAVLLPAIEILAPDDAGKLEAAIGRLEEFDIAIFISPTAVAKADAAVRVRREWPARLKYVAVGSGTAAALRAVGITEVVAPQGRGDSQAVAALPDLAEVAGRRIVIFRGQGGREGLREVLEARGAQVEYAECYRRAMPRVDVAPLVERWGRGGIDAVSVTSAEGIQNLFALLGAAGTAGAELLRATPVFVPHPSVGEAARSRGVERVILTREGDEALAEALASFFAKV